ncbi:Uncharacterized protein APZ42_008450 [Daphnia magna]|uniref:Uncharacterized protein n=1 Tax=Daphnia magna TaxID=35525 RepID=A0A164EMJ8_9CRUS|nr:Uncharacterized protein APZ42_008450 [Daphnia magna]
MFAFKTSDLDNKRLIKYVSDTQKQGLSRDPLGHSLIKRKSRTRTRQQHPSIDSLWTAPKRSSKQEDRRRSTVHRLSETECSDEERLFPLTPN